MDDNYRFCECGNPEPMQLRKGQFGAFYGCSRRSCKLTQAVGSPQPVVGSTAPMQREDTHDQKMQLWRIECHSIEQGYLDRKAWHEQRNMPFPETAPPPMPPIPGQSTSGNVRDLVKF